MKALITDLDGTLLNDQRKIGKQDFETLNELGRKGIIRIIATGRSLYSFNEVIPENFPIDYLVFSAGGGIYDFVKKNILRSFSLAREHVIKIATKLEGLGVDYQVRLKIPNSHQYYYRQFSKYNPDFQRLNEKYKNFITEIEDINSLGEASRFIIIAQEDNIVKLIEENFENYSIIRATSPMDNKSVWMEIYPQNVNKGTALRYLLSSVNVNISDTYGVGNDYNDIHFLEMLQKSYVVSNSPSYLKEKFKIIVSNNENPINYLVNNNSN